MGPGIAPGPRERGGVDQVCATLLALLGLPPGAGASRVHPCRGSRLPTRPWPITGRATADEPAGIKADVGGKRGGDREAAGPRLPRFARGNRPGQHGSTGTVGPGNQGLLRRQFSPRGVRLCVAASRASSFELHALALWNLSDVLHAQKRDLDRSDVLLLRALETGLPEGLDYTVGRTVAYTRGRRGRTRASPARPRAGRQARGASPTAAAGPLSPAAPPVRESSRRLRERRPLRSPQRPRPQLRGARPPPASATAKVPPGPSAARWPQSPTSRRSGGRWGKSVLCKGGPAVGENSSSGPWREAAAARIVVLYRLRAATYSAAG